MKSQLTAFVLAAALSVGAAHAAPGFGASSHRLGGDTASSSERAEAGKPIATIQYWLKLVGFDFSMSVEPVASDRYVGRTGKLEQCDEAKKTEVAKAESKGESDDASSKGRARPGEPVYLAF